MHKLLFTFYIILIFIIFLSKCLQDIKIKYFHLKVLATYLEAVPNQTILDLEVEIAEEA